ncbi:MULTISPECIES: hypothetical protein [unclassified Bacillus (in: firmicutes)]|nr:MULTISPECIES: hypothetical protein [unclassified Bacillus (in: firmicutes)]
MFTFVAFIVGTWVGMFFMSLFSVGAYEKGFKDGSSVNEHS